MLEKTKGEIIEELRKRDQRIKELEDKINHLNNGVFGGEKSFICKLFFENSKESYIFIKNERIVECNNAAVIMFGYTSKTDLIGSIVFEKISGEMEKNSLDSRYKEVMDDTDEKIVFEWIIQRKDGQSIPVEATITKIPTVGDAMSCVVLREISERKKIQKIILEKEKLYRNMFETNHFVILLIDPNSGKIIDANNAACLFYRYSKERLMNMNISKLNILNSDEKLIKVIKTAVEGKKNRFYLNQRLANDETRFVEVHCNQVNFNGKDLLYFIVHDLTKMKKILSALDESEKKFKELFNKANDAIWLCNVNRDGTVANFREVNDMACKMYGYDREKFLNMTIEDLRTPEDHDDILKKVGKVIKEGHNTFESVHVSKHGDKIPVEVNAHKFKLFGEEVIISIVRDITSRKWIEKFLRESEERNRRLVELLPDPIILQKDGRILYINNAAISFLGGENRHHFIGKDIFQFVDFHPSESKTLTMENLKEEMNNFSSFDEVKIIRKSDNAVLDAEIASTVFDYSNKKATLILMRDLCDRRKAEKYIKLFNDAIEFDKLKTQFFANLSHELRTPLNVILGTIQILTMYMKEKSLKNKDEKLENRIKILKQNCYRLLRLVNNLIDITKIDAGFYELSLQNHNIVNVVEEITLSVAGYVEQKKLKLVFDTDVEEKNVACDPDKIERIMLNLLSNAIKFTEPDGSIFVTMTDKGENIVISVKDTGIGIPKDELKYIFEHFRQVDKSFTRNHEGSGIGLSLVKSLVELHGGTINVNSEYGKGSEFVIELPAKILEDDVTIIRENSENEMESNLIEIINIEFSDIYA
ncbi:PAS domain S-box protein [Wukongibacter baidiensis]|uniref:PAS domain-containing sensor histidine kinase n=1 Tax=Wukongibacter baidiensis TaxID=1723361 RepID=UPI003D7F28C1